MHFRASWTNLSSSSRTNCLRHVDELIFVKRNELPSSCGRTYLRQAQRTAFVTWTNLSSSRRTNFLRHVDEHIFVKQNELPSSRGRAYLRQAEQISKRNYRAYAYLKINLICSGIMARCCVFRDKIGGSISFIMFNFSC